MNVYDATSDELEKHSTEAIKHLRAWSNRVRLPIVDKDRLAETISQAFKAVIEEVKKQGADGAKELARNTSSDPLLLALAPLLKGRVGPPFSKEDYDKEFKEAIQRGIDKLPPGYMDAKKEDKNSIGDYLIWAQILREAKTRQQDVLFVTSDNKEDWWRKDDNKDKGKQKSLGPRPELADELKQFSGKRLFMLPPERLLDWARTVLKDIDVSDESVQDVKQVSEAADVIGLVDSGNEGHHSVDALLQSVLTTIALDDAEIRAASERYHFVRQAIEAALDRSDERAGRMEAAADRNQTLAQRIEEAVVRNSAIARDIDGKAEAL